MAGCYQIPLPVVQSVLGHMSPEMTKYYQAHADREAKERYLGQMPNLLGTDEIPKLNLPMSSAREELLDLIGSLPEETVPEVLVYVKRINAAK